MTNKSSFVPEEQWPFQLVKSHLETRSLQTENVWLGRIQPKYASKAAAFVKEYRSIQNEKLLHNQRLRRIQKEGEPLILEVILCPEAAMTRDQLEKILADRGIEAELSVFGVPAFPPLTEEQFSEWSKVWPVSFRRPVDRVEQLTNAQLGQLDSVMDEVLRLARQQESSGNVPCAIAIYDLDNDTILSLQADDRKNSGNPLHHAAIQGINNVAVKERERRMLDHDPKEERYLCTNLTAVMSHEPCVMCSMALLHSRIHRLIYCSPQPSTGAMQSSYGIHWRTELNHRYLAYSNWKGKSAPKLDDSIHV
ncbi:tRNA specific adenosine deaminase subunit Tad3 [Schizosaccharomyces japonicus yFS275]|uniref:tRNA specific adenosine deaminase subunit Tad3 n=1 Tax=Schizosaccharomyces japonicus (strain yFS275 / FY16936) TaxID=402676 RepID=B6JVE4_SCHJY|nr:tRNA specific adenosine deaminase subunit Tad3 [Schizosaccharomyces japonicus yFS275]EEB05345.1 tRNA specific adenosine deaminase subunit Tad3 [Schizosaccharomyces japonicus yFS275]